MLLGSDKAYASLIALALAKLNWLCLSFSNKIQLYSVIYLASNSHRRVKIARQGEESSSQLFAINFVKLYQDQIFLCSMHAHLIAYFLLDLNRAV